MRLKQIKQGGYFYFKEYWSIHTKHKDISKHTLEKYTNGLLELGILIKGRKGYSVLSFRKAIKILLGDAILIREKPARFRLLITEIEKSLVINHLRRTKYAVGKQLENIARRRYAGKVDMIPVYLETKVVNAPFSCRSLEKAVGLSRFTTNAIINFLEKAKVIRLNWRKYHFDPINREFTAMRYLIDIVVPKSVEPFLKKSISLL